MKTRYWKWIYRGRIAMVFRLKNGKFEMYAQNRWQISDQYERAVQDPEFIEIKKQEAEELIKLVGVQ